jgi:hypothetical protein
LGSFLNGTGTTEKWDLADTISCDNPVTATVFPIRTMLVTFTVDRIASAFPETGTNFSRTFSAPKFETEQKR